MGREGVHTVASLRGTTVTTGSRRLAKRVSALLGEALASDDAESAGLRADDVLADPATALALLGGPDPWPRARHAVVQRYGRVGALLVAGYEGRAAQAGHGTAGNAAELERLLDGFAEMEAEEIEDLLARLGPAGCALDARAGEETAAARRWLEATYAVAARDGTEAAHRAYMEALDRVMRLAARRLAS